MQGNIRYVYSLEIVIVARSLRSLVKILSKFTTDPTRSQIRNMSPQYRTMNAGWIGSRLGYSFRASTASEGRGEMCHNPTVCAHGDIQLFRPAQGAGSLYPIAY